MAKTFKPGICHHRDKQGQPDCRKKKGKPYWLYCDEHERQYRATHVRVPRAQATAPPAKASPARATATMKRPPGRPRKAPPAQEAESQPQRRTHVTHVRPAQHRSH